MISHTLSNVRRYEAEEGDKVSPELRPLFHLTPRIGWMNDPNGFSQYKGKYHLFYQYYPYGKLWGRMHWGHAVTEDLLHWEYLPAALAPDSFADRDGCFSGSAITLEDGKHLLMYTGVIQSPDSEKEFFQRQCIAVGDGVDYVKQINNPVIEAKDLPHDSNGLDFRDPKIWKEQDGTYGCVCVDKDMNDHGRILYFKSNDAFSWHFHSILLENDGSVGKMWECPDVFELDGKKVLLFSPQDMLKKGNYPNGNSTIAMIGEFNDDGTRFLPETKQPIDSGIDFYATQTLLAEDGRRIMVAWMQNWDTILYTEKKIPWLGQMIVPRELSVKDNRLYQLPVREIEALRSNPVIMNDVEAEGVFSLDGIDGRTIDLSLDIRQTELKFQRFEIRLAQNDEYYTSLVYRPREGTLEFDRTNSGTRRAVLNSRKLTVEDGRESLKLRIIMDRYSVEVFINDGREAFTNCIFTPLDAQGIGFIVDGKALLDIEKYQLDQ